MKSTELARNSLIFLALIGLIFVGRAIGTAQYQAIQERQRMFESLSAALSQLESVPIETERTSTSVVDECKDDVYLSSLPAKCQTADGQLIEVGMNGAIITLMP